MTLDRSLLPRRSLVQRHVSRDSGCARDGPLSLLPVLRVDASLPYFIPLPPFLTITGTLGAVIRIREPFRTRTELFDIGVAGPVAGFIVLVPALFFGLTLSTVVPEPTSGS